MESMMMGDNEVDHQPQENDVRQVISRSYECIFCKRGFTTAQALGGHMNIHRKHRAKTNSKPNYNNLSNNSFTNYSSAQEEDQHSCYEGQARFHQPVFASYPPTYTPNYHHQESHVRYTSYLASTSNSPWPINHENNHQDFHVTSPSREEKRMSLSLQFGWSIGEDHRDSKRSFRDEYKQDDLDLELRLGHDP